MATKTKASVKTVIKAIKSGVAAPKAKPAAKAKQAPEPVAETRREEGYRIQDMMNAGPLTIAQLVERTGLSVERIESHVNYEVGKGRASINAKKLVVATSSPRRRTRSA